MNSRIADISARLQAQSDVVKLNSGSLNPTRFESDIVSAINGEKQLSGYQSGKAKTIAELCVKDMQKKFGGVKKAKQVSKDLAIGSGASVLSPIYRKFMCVEGMRCNGDPKCDIIMSSQMHGKMQISMKKSGDAQIATAQFGEANAVISAALGKDKEIVKTIRSILSETLNKKSYYDIRGKYEKLVGGDFDSTLATMMGMKTKASSPTSDEMMKFNQFLQIIGVKEKITVALKDYMESNRARKAIFKEFASGEKRFIESQSYRSADWFMIWSEQGKIEIEEIDSFVNTHYSSFRMNIRDRGGDSGGSLRIDIREQSEYHAQLEKELQEEFDMFCLTEGVLDTTVELMRSAGSLVVTAYKKFIGAVKTALSFIVSLFASGFSDILQFFGLETTEMSYSW